LLGVFGLELSKTLARVGWRALVPFRGRSGPAVGSFGEQVIWSCDGRGVLVVGSLVQVVLVVIRGAVGGSERVEVPVVSGFQVGLVVVVRVVAPGSLAGVLPGREPVLLGGERPLGSQDSGSPDTIRRFS
jgi:hypothetical protein